MQASVYSDLAIGSLHEIFVEAYPGFVWYCFTTALCTQQVPVVP